MEKGKLHYVVDLNYVVVLGAHALDKMLSWEHTLLTLKGCHSYYIASMQIPQGQSKWHATSCIAYLTGKMLGINPM